jgi:hypothetical protein
MAETYSFDNMATYLGNLVDEAINSTMACLMPPFSGSVQTGFNGWMGGMEPIQISPLGGHYEGSSFVQGGQVTDQRTGTPAIFRILDGGWPFEDLQGMYDYYWKRVNDIFDPWWQTPMPFRFDAQVQQAAKLASTLNYSVQSSVGPADTDYFPANGDLSNIQTIQQRVSNLDGAALLTFEQNFSNRIDDVVNAQCAAAVLAWIGVAGEQKIWEKAHESLANIAGTGVEAMKHARPSGGGGGLKAIVNVLGAVSLVAAEFATEGLVTPLVVAGVGAQTASDFIPEGEAQETEEPLGAGDPISVFDKIEAAINDLKAKIRTEEEGISTRLGKLNTAMYGGSRGGFDLSEPALAHVDDKSQLYRTGEIKADYDVIRDVAQKFIPRVSGALNSASSLACDTGNGAWSRPDGIGSGSDGPYAAWSSLNIAIKGVTLESAKSLYTAGDALVILANDFGKSDAQVRHDMDVLANRLDAAKAAAAQNAH